MSDARTLVAEGLHNARDLGGLPVRGGGTTPTGRLFRSESVDRLTSAGWDSLYRAGVRTIVDLRAPWETEKDTGVRPDWSTTLVIDHDDLDDQAFWAGYWDSGLVGTPLYYGPHLARKPERTVAVLRAIAGAGPGAVLFHCAGGRDRTGIVSLVLLALAGVEPEAVVQDHLQTVVNAPALYAAIGAAPQEDRIEALCAAHGTSVEGAFRAVVAEFDVDVFVASAGLTPSELEALRTFRAHVT